MATSKTATKKPAAAKATKKPATARKAPVKAKTTATKARSTKAVAVKKPSKKSAANMQSFRVYRDSESFSTFRVTRQTVYWVILVAFIVFAQLWILKLQVEISSLLQQQQDSALFDN